MKHNDIEKLFHNRLEELSPDDFPFEEGAWDEVESTLDREGILLPSKRKWGGIFPIALLLLLLSNVLVGWKYFSAEQEVQTLSATVQELERDLQEASSQATSQNNSQDNTNNDETQRNDEERLNSNNSNNLTSPKPQIIEKIVEVPVERIVEKIVYVPVERALLSQNTSNNNSIELNNSNNNLFNELSNSLTNPTSNTNKSKLQLTYSNENGLKTQEIDNYLFPSSRNNSNIFNNNSVDNINPQFQSIITDNTNDPALSDNNTVNIENDVKADELIDFLQLIDWSDLDTHADTLNTDEIEELIKEPSERKLSFVDQLGLAASYVKVSNYEVGVTNGYDFLYQNTDFNPLSTRYGLTGEVRFSDYIKIGTGVDWREAKSELEDIQDAGYPDEFFDPFPNLTSGISPNDMLNKIEFYDRAIEFSLFAKYLITPKAAFTPYIGAGVRGEYDYQQRFEYKYLLAPDFNVEYETDYIYLNNNQLGINTIMAMVGVEYQFLPSFTLRLETLYNYDYQPHRFDNSQLQWFSGNVGVLYKFRKTKTRDPFSRR